LPSSPDLALAGGRRIHKARHSGAVAEPAACAGIVTQKNIIEEAAMSDQWRSATGRPDAGHADDHDAAYIGGWAVSGLMAVATILLLWHFQI
jgi:hypothetical protein